MTLNKNDDDTLKNSQLDFNLKEKSIRGGAVTLFSRGAKFVLQMVSTVILARILAPADFGMIAMVTAVTGFANTFSSLGLSTVTIQKEDISHAQVSTLFWINSGMGLLITAFVAGLSPIVSWFYQRPQLSTITLVLSLNFLFSGMSIQHHALLSRQMRFVTIAKIQIFSSTTGILASVVAAYCGFHYWALVLNILVSSLCHLVGVWVALEWRPAFTFQLSAIRSLLSYGVDVAGFNIINYFSRNLDNVLIGRFLGEATLGIYSKAYHLLMLPIINIREPLSKVALPSLSRLQSEPNRYRLYYKKFISVLAFISMPLVVFMFVLSDSLVVLILGSQWSGVSEIFRIFSVLALIQPVLSTRGLVLLSTGQSRKYFWWGLLNAFVISISFIVGIKWGAKGVASSYVVANYLFLYPSLVFVFTGSALKVRDFFTPIVKPILASIVMGFSVFYLHSSMVGFGNISILFVCFFAGVVFYLLAIIGVSGGMKDLREYYSYGALLIKNKNNVGVEH